MSQFPYLIMTPGPVALSPSVRSALSEQMIHHRTPEFEKILSRCLQNLKKVFQTEQDVIIINASGSGAMEAAVINLLSPGDQCLVVNAGKFGERWLEMNQAYGIQSIDLQVKWGEAVSVIEIKNSLKQNPNCKAIMVQACETSTASIHPIQEICQLKKEYPNLLIIVDAITALGAYHIPMDDWNIDALISGSQKAWMLPTGISFICLSKQAWQAAEHSKCPKYYFNLKSEKKAQQSAQTYFSSAVAHIKALDTVLNEILSPDAEIGLKKLFQELNARAYACRKALSSMGFEVFSKSPSASISAFILPQNLDSDKFRNSLESKYNLSIMGGQNQLKSKIVRIGHMGYLSEADHLDALQRIHLCLKDFHIESDLQKAQKIYSETYKEKIHCEL